MATRENLSLVHASDHGFMSRIRILYAFVVDVFHPCKSLRKLGQLFPRGIYETESDCCKE